MELVDITPLEKWMELEDDIYERTGLNACVFNPEGARIAVNRNWANDLCPKIKGTDKGQTFICAVAHSNIATMARNSHKSIIEECDAGLIKMVVPIYVKDEFLGVFSGCGLIPEDGEIDSFYINKTTEINEDEIMELAKSVKTLSNEDAKSTIAYIEQELDKIIQAYEAG